MKILLALCLLTSLLGCTAPEEPRATEEPKETVFDPLTSTLDRARDVDRISRQRKEQLDQQLEETQN